jgi:hypothetical protein
MPFSHTYNKPAQLKVENSAQTTFRFSPISYRPPRPKGLDWLQLKMNITITIKPHLYRIHSPPKMTKDKMSLHEMTVKAGITKGGSITVPLTSCVTGLD